MIAPLPPNTPPEDRIAPILYGCLEAVGSTKGAVYVRQEDGGFGCLTHFGWPRGFGPPAVIPVLDPLLIMVQRARRSFAVNEFAEFPELRAFGEGSELPRLFISPVYLMGDWVALLIQRDKQRHEPYDEEADGPATLRICNALAAEWKAFRAQGDRELPPDLFPPEPAPLVLEPLPEEPRPLIINRTIPMPVQPRAPLPSPSAEPAPPLPTQTIPTGEKLSAYHPGFESMAWEGDSKALPGTESLRSDLDPKRQGRYLPEQRTFFWEMAALMARIFPCAALAFWMEEVDEVRPIFCFSPQPLSDGLKQQILAHATFHLPQVQEQDLRLLAWSPEGATSTLEGGFATQSTLPLGRGSEDLLMVFRMEYAPLDEKELRALAPTLRLLRQFLEESRAHERYHQAFLSFANRILASADERAPGLRLHSLGCAKWARDLAIHLDLPSHQTEAIAIAAILHDVGGLMLDPALQKKADLQAEDWKQIKAHPVQASVFLKDLEFPVDVLGLIASHHERWDGRGYPAGLAREAIPLGARVLGLADAFEAMTQGRTHRAPITVEAARAELEMEAGHQFDPGLVEAFLGLIARQELSGVLPALEG